MNYAQKFFGHLKTVTKHKYWVWYYMHKCGKGWQGFWHDASKFSPTEFWESVKYYSGTRSPIDACKEDKGVSVAWMHHKGRNPHHYEYWQDNFDNGGNPVEMPEKYKAEMLCDYIAAGRAYMGKNFTFAAEYEWWQNKCKLPRRMHPHDRQFIERCLYVLMTDERFGQKCNLKDTIKTIMKEGKKK
jgi:hypothetical protein